MSDLSNYRRAMEAPASSSAWLSSFHNQRVKPFTLLLYRVKPICTLAELADLTSRVFSDATFRQSSIVGCLAESGRAPHQPH